LQHTFFLSLARIVYLYHQKTYSALIHYKQQKKEVVRNITKPLSTWPKEHLCAEQSLQLLSYVDESPSKISTDSVRQKMCLLCFPAPPSKHMEQSLSSHQSAWKYRRIERMGNANPMPYDVQQNL
jgi:hypothetical protein